MPFIIGGAILGAGVIGGLAANKSANTQASSANNATAAQLGMFNQTQANLQPYMGAGTTALNQLQQMTASPTSQLLQPFGMEQFQQSPAYQFNLQQGQEAINKGANARGNYYAPQTLQDLGKFQQGLASNEFQNAYSNYNQNQQNIWNRLYGLAGSGQNAAANLGAFSGQVSGQVGNNMQNAGASQAAGIMGVGNAAQGTLGSLANLYLGQQYRGNQGSLYGVSNPGFQNYDPATGATLF